MLREAKIVTDREKTAIAVIKLFILQSDKWFALILNNIFPTVARRWIMS